MSPWRIGTADTVCTTRRRASAPRLSFSGAATISAMMQGFYKEVVLDHYQRPRNRGELENADIEEHLNNPLCGDEVTVYAKLRDGKVANIRFTGRGCSISQASASMLTERLSGKDREEAEAEIEAFLEMMRTEEKEELGDLVPLKGIIPQPRPAHDACLRCPRGGLVWVHPPPGVAANFIPDTEPKIALHTDDDVGANAFLVARQR